VNRKLVVSFYLAGLVWVVFGQTLRQQFVNFDDSAYVYENWEVVKGVTWEGLAWAFRHTVLYLWNPLTVLSHMLDCQIFGLAPAGHHLVNVLLHIATAILLFLFLQRTTGALWPGAFVAAVFAIHPLRVESVAWVSERKDVLSGLFFMLTLGAYVRRSFLLTPLFFALGLLAKPMLVTLPCVLLLLDYWPLNRWKTMGMKKLVLEKLPLFALSAASCVATLLIQDRLPGVGPHNFPLSQRIGNALVSPVTYLVQMVYPAGLAVLYPFPPGGQPLWKVAGAAVILAAITLLVWRWRERRPYLWMGWLWYLGMLAPVLGILQMGRESHADRYTYLPQIGIYIMITWAAEEVSAPWPRRREILGGLAVLVLAPLALCARIQTSYWKDSETLWRRMLAETSDIPMAMPHLNLGIALAKKGDAEAAIAQYRRAIEINPDYADADTALGNALLQSGRGDDAVAYYRKSLSMQPMDLTTQNNLAWVLATSTNPSVRNGPAALELARQASRTTRGENALVLRTLAAAYAETGRFPEAVEAAGQALQAAGGADTPLSNALRDEMALYRSGIPYRYKRR